MRLDSERVFCNGAMGHEPDSRPVEYNDNALDSIGLESRNGIVKEIENGGLCDLKGMEADADQLPNVAPVPSSCASLKMEPFEESVFYMDKSVMECEVPELIVCYKENTYHVKDICVDEGVPLQDKFFSDADAPEKNACEFLPSERDTNNEMVEEKSDPDVLNPYMLKSSSEKQNVDLHLPVPDVLLSSEEKTLKYGLSVDCDPNLLMPTGEAMDCVAKKVAKDASKEISSLRDLLSMPELGSKFTPTDSTNHSMDKVEQSLQCPRENAILERDSASEESENCSEETMSLSSTFVAAAEELDNGHEAGTLAIPIQDPAYQDADNGHKEAVLASPTLTTAGEELDSSKETKLASHALDSFSEESTSRIADQLPYNRKLETRSICFDNDCSAPTASGREPTQNGETQHLGNRIMSSPEDPIAESPSGQLQYADGESSFSASGPLSSLISDYSGLIANSGSVSLRSDSSTTSTRSFAFPVLQSEWNSSPVRMAKADRRHFPKPRSWRQGLLCCRF